MESCASLYFNMKFLPKNNCSAWEICPSICYYSVINVHMDSGVFHFYFELWSNMTILLWPNLFCSLPLTVPSVGSSVGNRRSLYWVKSWVHMYCEPELCRVENSLAKPFLHLGQSQERVAKLSRSSNLSVLNDYLCMQKQATAPSSFWMFRVWDCAHTERTPKETN